MFIIFVVVLAFFTGSAIGLIIMKLLLSNNVFKIKKYNSKLEKINYFLNLLKTSPSYNKNNKKNKKCLKNENNKEICDCVMFCDICNNKMPITQRYYYDEEEGYLYCQQCLNIKQKYNNK